MGLKRTKSSFGWAAVLCLVGLLSLPGGARGASDDEITAAQTLKAWSFVEKKPLVEGRPDGPAGLVDRWARVAEIKNLVSLYYWRHLPPQLTPQMHMRVASHRMAFFGPENDDPEVALLSNMIVLHAETAGAYLRGDMSNPSVYFAVASFVDRFGRHVAEQLVERYDLDPALIPVEPEATW